MVKRKLDKPMTDHDFIQITLLANSIAVFEMVIKMEKQGSVRRCEYANILMRLRRAEASIEGHLEGRTLDQSIRFYQDMEQAVGRFRRSFEDAKPVGHDSSGKFCRL